MHFHLLSAECVEAKFLFCFLLALLLETLETETLQKVHVSGSWNPSYLFQTSTSCSLAKTAGCVQKHTHSQFQQSSAMSMKSMLSGSNSAFSCKTRKLFVWFQFGAFQRGEWIKKRINPVPSILLLQLNFTWSYGCMTNLQPCDMRLTVV